MTIKIILPKPETRSVGQIQFGSVFSGTIRGTTSTFICTDVGLFDLGQAAPWNSLFYKFTGDDTYPEITNYREHKAELVINADLK